MHLEKESKARQNLFCSGGKLGKWETSHTNYLLVLQYSMNLLRNKKRRKFSRCNFVSCKIYRTGCVDFKAVPNAMQLFCMRSIEYMVMMCCYAIKCHYLHSHQQQRPYYYYTKVNMNYIIIFKSKPDSPSE